MGSNSDSSDFDDQATGLRSANGEHSTKSILVWCVGHTDEKLSTVRAVDMATSYIDPFRVPIRWAPRLVWSVIMTSAKKKKRNEMHEQALRQGGDGAPCYLLQVLYLFMRSWYLLPTRSVKIQRRNFRWMMRVFRPYSYPSMIRKVRMQQLTTPENVNMFMFLPSVKPKGVLFYVHGGGGVMGSAHEEYVHVVRMLCDRSGATVYALHYPKAPKQPFPFAVDACIEGFKFLAARHGSEEIVMAGDDMGANIVLTSLVVLRDTDCQMPKCCYLFSPVDLCKNPPHLERVASDYLPQNCVQFIRRKYFGDQLPNHCEEFTHLHGVALCDMDLRSLPPTCIVTSTDDFLLHDALTLATRMLDVRPAQLDQVPRMEPDFVDVGASLDGEGSGEPVDHNNNSGSSNSDEEFASSKRVGAADDDDEDDLDDVAAEDDRLFGEPKRAKKSLMSRLRRTKRPQKKGTTPSKVPVAAGFSSSETQRAHVEVFVWRNLPHSWFLVPLFRESVMFFDWFGFRLRGDLEPKKRGRIPQTMAVTRARYEQSGYFWARRT